MKTSMLVILFLLCSQVLSQIDKQDKIKRNGSGSYWTCPKGRTECTRENGDPYGHPGKLGIEVPCCDGSDKVKRDEPGSYWTCPAKKPVIEKMHLQIRMQHY